VLSLFDLKEVGVRKMVKPDQTWKVYEAPLVSTERQNKRF